MRSVSAKWIGVLPVILAVFCTGAGAAAQIPGQHLNEQPDANTQWTQLTRTLSDSIMQDWITAAEQADPETIAGLFTDQAVLVDVSGERAQGRDAVRALLERLPERKGFATKLSRSVLGERILHTTGRMWFTENGVEGTYSFTALLERHHGRWQVRAMAIAPASEAVAQAPMPRDALVPRKQRIRAPERKLVRVVVEPMLAREHVLTERYEPAWSGYGAGLGLEINRALELRGFAWQGERPAVGEPLLSYGAEARLYMLERWRTRPFLSLGAALFQGTGAPDTGWVPAVGAGVSVRALSHLDVQVSVRNHFPTTPDGVYETAFVAEKRAQRPLISAGLSIPLGRRPRWRDAEPTPIQRQYEVAHSAEVLQALHVWQTTLDNGTGMSLSAPYSAFAELHHEGALHSGDDILQVLRAEEALRDLQPQSLRVSGAVAYAAMSWGDGEAGRSLLTILHRDRKGWKIASQILR